MATIQVDLSGLSSELNVVNFVVPISVDEEYIYTMGDEDVLAMDCTNNFCVVNLPLAVNSDGRRFTFVKTDSTTNCIGLRSTPVDDNELESDLIGGGFPYMIYKQHQSVTIVCDGTEWQIESVN